MTDITERLRRWSHDVNAVPASDLMDEAADRIELDARTISALIADGQAMKDRIVNGERARWISVEERLPEIGALVIASFNKGFVEPMRRHATLGFWTFGSNKNGGYTTDVPVTHWMPLPKPPEVTT